MENITQPKKVLMAEPQLLKTIALVLFTLLSNILFSQKNDCLPLLQDGLYKTTIKETSTSFDGNLKSYLESETFKQDFKSGKWSLGMKGVIPIGETGLMGESNLNAGASEDEINTFQEKIRTATSVQIDDRFYKSSVTAVPDVGLAKAYVKCIDIKSTTGFKVKEIIATPDKVIFNIIFRNKISSDPMPIIKNIAVLGSTEIVQSPKPGDTVLDEFNVSARRYPESDLILSINTDRGNLVSIVEASDVGFAKEFPVGSIITSVLDWRSFSEIAESKSTNEWDSKKSKWAPADGRSVATSLYSRKSGKANVPDLRGVFLRGLNRFDPFYTNEVADLQKDHDGVSRVAGSLQQDEITSHVHDFSYTVPQNEASNGGGSGHRVADKNTTLKSKTESFGGSETRPTNVAVFYYIRIN